MKIKEETIQYTKDGNPTERTITEYPDGRDTENRTITNFKYNDTTGFWEEHYTWNTKTQYELKEQQGTSKQNSTTTFHYKAETKYDDTKNKYYYEVRNVLTNETRTVENLDNFNRENIDKIFNN